MAEPKLPQIDGPINGGLQNNFIQYLKILKKASNQSKLLNQRKKLILKRKMN